LNEIHKVRKSVTRYIRE